MKYNKIMLGVLLALSASSVLASDEGNDKFKWGITNTLDIVVNDDTDVINKTEIELTGKFGTDWRWLAKPVILLGEQPNDYIGANQGIDNIEFPEEGVRVLEAYVAKDINDKWSAKAGILAVDSDFYVSENASLFVSPTFGMSTEVAQTGENGPSIYPITGLGVNVSYINGNKYAQVSVMDGVPGNPNNAESHDLSIHGDDGAFIIAEGGLADENHKLSLGAWGYTEKTAHINGSANSDKNYGVYALAEGLYGDKWGWFARVGYANDKVNHFDLASQLGVIRKDLFREGDALGFAVGYANVSDKSMGDNETIYELTYKTNITENITIQPSLQRVAGTVDETVFIARVGYSF